MVNFRNQLLVTERKTNDAEEWEKLNRTLIALSLSLRPTATAP